MSTTSTRIGQFDIGSRDKVEHLLAQPGLAKFEPTLNGYSFWLTGIPVEIKIVLSVNGDRGGFNFHTSHVIKTPKQTGPYHPSRPWGDDAGYALHQAVTSITQHYDDATKAGLKPEAAWLIPNNNFGQWTA